jgi:hypothetical protein
MIEKNEIELSSSEDDLNLFAFQEAVNQDFIKNFIFYDAKNLLKNGIFI